MSDAFILSSRGHAPAAPETSGLASRWHTLLLVAFLGYTFIGLHPYEETSVAGRADGNILDRIVVLGMFGLALWLIFERREVFRRSLALRRR